MKMVEKSSSSMAGSALDAAMSDRVRIGRPSKSARPGGQQTIIASMQNFMRSRPLTNVQRLEIAEYAGVTPALISYYFPDKLDLIIVSASPLISTYMCRIRNILNDCSDIMEGFRSLAYEFIDFNFKSGYLLDYYLDATMRKKRSNEIADISAQYGDIILFMRRIVEGRAARVIDPAFLQSSLWAHCKYLGRQPHLLSIADQDEAEFAIRILSEETFKLFTKGILS